MVKRKSTQSRNSNRRVHYKKKSSRPTDDISNHTLVMMILLVVVVSILSAIMYVYAFYGGYSIQASQEQKSIVVEQSPVSGVASIQIIKPPEGSK